MSLKRPFAPKSDVKQWFTTTTNTNTLNFLNISIKPLVQITGFRYRYIDIFAQISKSICVITTTIYLAQSPCPIQVRPSDHRTEQTTGWMKMGPVDTYSLTGSHKKYAHPATRDVELMLIWSATVAQHQTNIGLTTRGCSTVSQRLWCRPSIHETLYHHLVSIWHLYYLENVWGQLRMKGVYSLRQQKYFYTRGRRAHLHVKEHLRVRSQLCRATFFVALADTLGTTGELWPLSCWNK